VRSCPSLFFGGSVAHLQERSSAKAEELLASGQVRTADNLDELQRQMAAGCPGIRTPSQSSKDRFCWASSGDSPREETAGSGSVVPVESLSSSLDQSWSSGADAKATTPSESRSHNVGHLAAWASVAKAQGIEGFRDRQDIGSRPTVPPNFATNHNGWGSPPPSSSSPSSLAGGLSPHAGWGRPDGQRPKYPAQPSNQVVFRSRPEGTSNTFLTSQPPAGGGACREDRRSQPSRAAIVLGLKSGRTSDDGQAELDKMLEVAETRRLASRVHAQGRAELRASQTKAANWGSQEAPWERREFRAECRLEAAPPPLERPVDLASHARARTPMFSAEPPAAFQHPATGTSKQHTAHKWTPMTRTPYPGDLAAAKPRPILASTPHPSYSGIYQSSSSTSPDRPVAPGPVAHERPGLAMAAATPRQLPGALPPPPVTHAPGTAELPSSGSAKHSTGHCKPCAFLYTKGCATGLSCPFCHLCEPGERKRRQREKLLMRTQTKANPRAKSEANPRDGLLFPTCKAKTRKHAAVAEPDAATGA